MREMITAMSLALALAACGGHDEEREFEESEDVLAEHEAAGEPVDDEWADDGPTADEVPVQADFRGEAEASINETNYGQALDAIEAELGE
tara:strand:+ start:648 stop:917 length:270 start_codon:yes stop_codon:yes gene_type:complete